MIFTLTRLNRLIAVWALMLTTVCARNLEPLAPPSWLESNRWEARWITHPDATKNDYGIYRFRKSWELAAKPETFVVNVTGDARYRLFVNGQSVVFGPQRSDAWRWHYETVDIAPWLVAGRNVLAAEVWSYGSWTPAAIMGVKTGFLLQGSTDAEQAVNTDESWEVSKDASFSPIPVELKTYIVVGPGARVDGSNYPWGWELTKDRGTDWTAARVLEPGSPYGHGELTDHWLSPRTIPLMLEKEQRLLAVRRTEGVSVLEAFLSGNAPITVSPNSRATIVLDQGVNTNAFPHLTVSGGRGSRVRVTYAEAMIDEAGRKGHRDEVEGRVIKGVADEFVADGGMKRRFGPLDFRTYRYVELTIETGNEALIVDDFYGTFTSYPFLERASFQGDDPELKKIWDVAWRTALMCAFETYVDCPYYEQLQYVGDTRIQALISLYVSGDDRLMRNAIVQYDRSRGAEGLTKSRYPSGRRQVITTFSLYWIDMVHDYWRHREDREFVEERLAGVEAVLNWFDQRIDPETQLLGPLEYWTFADWATDWPWIGGVQPGGEPPGARTGGSAFVSLQLAGTLTRAAELAAAFGREDAARRYAVRAAELKNTVRRLCWDEGRQLFADTPDRREFSQHTNSLAVLYGLVEGDAARALMRRVIDRHEKMTQSTVYFRFYVLRALKQAGLGDLYLEQLGAWRDMLDIGLTTFAEKEDPTRSDCHAWSSSPMYEFLATVAGIEPAAPGFATVRIAPHLGALDQVVTKMPHPRGEIAVSLKREGDGITGEIVLPAGVTGSFHWNGQEISLQPGRQDMVIP
jgi:alpha-L-rhamnosidase